MRVKVNHVLRTSYKGREWDEWFETAAKKIIEHLDASSIEAVLLFALTEISVFSDIFVRSYVVLGFMC